MPAAGIGALLLTLLLSVCVVLICTRCSRTGDLEVPGDEDHFKRDNLATYCIEGGYEEELEDEDAQEVFRYFTAFLGRTCSDEESGTQDSRQWGPRDHVHCACAYAEPVKVGMSSCFFDDASIKAITRAQVHVQKQDPPGILQRDPKRREGGEGGEVKKAKHVRFCDLDETVCRERTFPEGHDSYNTAGNRRMDESATCHGNPRAAATDSVFDTPPPLDLLPADAIQSFSLEGYGSPAISLGTLGN